MVQVTRWRRCGCDSGVGLLSRRRHPEKLGEAGEFQADGGVDSSSQLERAMVKRRAAIALTGLLLLVGGALFDALINFDFDDFHVWEGFSGAGAVLIVPGLLLAAGARYLPGSRINILLFVSIPIAVVSAVGLALFGAVIVICACD